MGVGFDAREVRQLFERHGAMVYRRALRILGNPADAEEALQEVFLRVMRGAPGFEERSQVTTWLYRITTNYCLNVVRDGKRRRELLETRYAGADSEPGSADDLLLLRLLLSEADEEQAQAAVYVYLDGMSHEEAARVLGVSRRTVGNLLERFGAWAARRSAGRTDSQAPAVAVGADAEKAASSLGGSAVRARGGRP